MEGSAPPHPLDSLRDREARVIGSLGPSARPAPWKFLKTLTWASWA